MDAFQRAHEDGKKAIATFLPSLVPKQPAPAPQPPPATSPLVREGVRTASLARHVEMASKRVARGMPPEPPPPPSPQETFGGELDPVHIRAMGSAIEAHPEELRSPLIHELHDTLTKWISSQNGRVVIDGRMELATSPESAEKLAQKIINDGVENHDQREQAKQEAVQESAGNGTQDNPNITGSGGRGDGTPSSARNGSRSITQNVPPVGTVDPSSDRIITQPTSDLDQAQQLATAAAPELKKNLKSVARQVDGANVDGVRDKKDPTRVQEKIDKEGKPVNTMTDLVAGRIAVDSPEAKEQAVAAIKGSMPVVDEEDKFQQGDPDYGFRSHTLQAGLSNGATAEVQVVPEEIADADEDTHETYERGRQAEIDGDTETAKQAMADNKDTHDQAMQEFNARNQGKSAPDIRKILEAAGIKVSGDPIKLGGHLFIGVES